MSKTFSKLLSVLLGCLLWAQVHASEGTVHLDRFPAKKVNDIAALQNGAKLFANYCQNCHAAAFMRYTSLRSLGLTDVQIKQNLMFPTDKMAETMKVAMDPAQAKEWFGATPPDLSLIARAKGVDYLYTYLRSFYLDPTRPTGWNNTVFPNVGMPHALWQLQGQRAAVFKEEADPHDPAKKVHSFDRFEQVTPGQLAPQEYDDAVADLVAYLNWMGEPAQGARVRIGVGVLLFLFLFTIVAWRLNAAFWKDVN